MPTQFEVAIDAPIPVSVGISNVKLENDAQIGFLRVNAASTHYTYKIIQIMYKEE